jgi:hypothetical protein
MNVKKHTSKKAELPAGKTPADLTAKENGLPEFPLRPKADSLYMDEIHHRAETMTPLLQGILDIRP